MSLNPMTLMQLKTSWDRFIQAHPKFPKFWMSAYKSGLTQGTIIEKHLTEKNWHPTSN